jgi:hypothetical protein
MIHPDKIVAANSRFVGVRRLKGEPPRWRWG